jgi:hypothetical protein
MTSRNVDTSDNPAVGATGVPQWPVELEALGMAVRQQFGHLCADAARGLALRHDHASNFMAEHFQKQIRFWGIAPSYAFVGEQTQWRHREALPNPEGADRPLPHLPDHRGGVRRRARLCRPLLIAKNGFRSPRDPAPLDIDSL